jgi:hypothetical protein
MKLIVPAVYEDGFLERMAELPIAHYYGATATDAGLRANGELPAVADDAFAAYVARAHSQGQQFFYCLNVACLGNREFTAEGSWLVERFAGSPTSDATASCRRTLMVGFAKRRFPKLAVAVERQWHRYVDKALYSRRKAPTSLSA